MWQHRRARATGWSTTAEGPSHWKARFEYDNTDMRGERPSGGIQMNIGMPTPQCKIILAAPNHRQRTTVRTKEAKARPNKSHAACTICYNMTPRHQRVSMRQQQTDPNLVDHKVSGNRALHWFSTIPRRHPLAGHGKDLQWRIATRSKSDWGS